MLIGIAGIAVSLMLCAFAFNQATYELTDDGYCDLKGRPRGV